MNISYVHLLTRSRGKGYFVYSYDMIMYMCLIYEGEHGGVLGIEISLKGPRVGHVQRSEAGAYRSI